MFSDIEAFSGFSINDVNETTHFYRDLLGMDVTPVPGMEDYGMLELHIKNGHTVLMYHKDTHTPATFTVLSFPVPDIDDAVQALNDKGITMERYDGMQHDDKGIVRGRAMDNGPDIAWFNDPSGNNLAVLQTA